MTRLSKLDEFQIILSMDAKYLPDEYISEIFHYTSPQGFQSILFNNPDCITLWASRFDCLNDVSEGTIAEEILKEVCNELLQEQLIDQYLYELFSNVAPAKTTLLFLYDGDTIKATRSECNRFVCSFSKNRDSLAMWNYYSKGSKYEGFNIGFFNCELKTTLETYFKNKEAVSHIFPVIYSKEEQKQLVSKMLIKLKELYKKEREPQIRYIIANRLLDWSLIFKKEYFQHEEEVRIIIDVAKKEEKIPIKYRINSGLIVPYIELPIEKMCLSEVTFGPVQTSENQMSHQIKVMEELLISTNYPKSVNYSKIPVRF